MSQETDLIARIEALEKRIEVNQSALNQAIEARDTALLGGTIGLLQMAVGLFVLWIAADAAQTWMSFFGLGPALGLLPSIIIAAAIAYGVMRLLSPVVAAVTERGMKRLPKLPEWQSEND